MIQRELAISNIIMLGIYNKDTPMQPIQKPKKLRDSIYVFIYLFFFQLFVQSGVTEAQVMKQTSNFYIKNGRNEPISLNCQPLKSCLNTASKPSIKTGTRWTVQSSGK